MRDEKKPGERTCPLDCCPTFVRSLKVHVRNCHLPWYVFEAGTDREMLVRSLLSQPMAALNVQSYSELLEQVTQRKLHPIASADRSFDISEEDADTISEVGKMLGIPAKYKVLISPPRIVPELLHWRVIICILNSVPFQERKKKQFFPGDETTEGVSAEVEMLSEENVFQMDKRVSMEAEMMSEENVLQVDKIEVLQMREEHEEEAVSIFVAEESMDDTASLIDKLTASEVFEPVRIRADQLERELPESTGIKVIKPFTIGDLQLTTVIDSHMHLDRCQSMMRNRRRQVVEIPFSQVLTAVVANFCDPESFPTIGGRGLRIGNVPKITRKGGVVPGDKEIMAARNHVTIGIHPLKADMFFENERAIDNLLKCPEVIAVGECGLDFSKGPGYNPSDIEAEGRNHKLQLKVLTAMLEKAVKTKRPVVLHCRDVPNSPVANMKLFNVCRKVLGKDHKIHLHCYTGSWLESEEWLREFRNVHFGFTNLVINQKLDMSRTIHSMRLDRIMLESDSPHLPPFGVPGEINTPASIRYVAEFIASAKEITPHEVYTVTAETTKNFYNI